MTSTENDRENDNEDVSPYQMSAEESMETLDVTPIRFSGYIALLLALLTPIAVFTVQLVAAGVAAIGFALWAMRPYRSNNGQRPFGVMPAKIALVVSLLFSSFGFIRDWSERASLKSDAELFAKRYVSVVARDEIEFALQLMVHPDGRISETADFRSYYAENQQADANRVLFLQKTAVEGTIAADHEKIDFQPSQPTQIQYFSGTPTAWVFMRDRSGQVSDEVKVDLKLSWSRKNERREWYVTDFETYHEPLYAGHKQ